MSSSSATTDREIFQAAVQKHKDYKADPNLAVYERLYNGMRPYLLAAAKRGETNLRVQIDTHKNRLDADVFFGGFCNWVHNKHILLIGIMKVERKWAFLSRYLLYTIEFDWAI